MVPLLVEFEDLTKDIEQLIKFTPISKNNMDGEKDVFHIELVKNLYTFYLLSIMEKYIQLEQLVDDVDFAVIDDIEISEREIQERQQQTDMIEGNKVEIIEKISNLIASYLLIFRRYKDRINMNREEIMRLVLRSKEKEKNVKTRQLRDLTDEERNVDSELRKAKLGRWNIGMQKGLTQYDKKFYDTERIQMEEEAIIESKLGGISDVTTMNSDIYAMDILERELADVEAETEANDMSNMANDDDYGDNDGDEQFY